MGIPNNDMNITQVNCCGLVYISIIYCTNYCYMYINEKFNFDVIINCILFLELLHVAYFFKFCIERGVTNAQKSVNNQILNRQMGEHIEYCA